MCGLFGAKSNYYLGKDEKANVQKLAVYSSFRGWHSAGMSFGSRGKKDSVKYQIHKEVSDPWAFITGKPFNQAKEAQGLFLMLGHNRMATIGEITHDNAHPYWHEGVIGAHNGTIPNLKPKDDKGTDSFELIKLIGSEGLKKAVKEAGYGAFAITYTDRRDGTFNMVRNEQRELWLTANVKNLTMYWASAKAILKHMIEEADGEFSEPQLLKPFIQYKFPLNSLDCEEIDVRPEPTRSFLPVTGGLYRKKKEVDGLPAGTVQHNKMITDPAFKESFLLELEVDKQKEEEKDGSIPFDKPAVAALRVRLEDRKKPCKLYAVAEYKLVSTEDAANLLADGCFHCTQSANVKDMVWWLDRESFFCNKCVQLHEVQKLVGPKDYLYKGINFTNMDELKHRPHQIKKRFM